MSRWKSIMQTPITAHYPSLRNPIKTLKTEYIQTSDGATSTAQHLLDQLRTRPLSLVKTVAYYHSSLLYTVKLPQCTKLCLPSSQPSFSSPRNSNFDINCLCHACCACTIQPAESSKQCFYRNSLPDGMFSRFLHLVSKREQANVTA